MWIFIITLISFLLQSSTSIQRIVKPEELKIEDVDQYETSTVAEEADSTIGTFEAYYNSKAKKHNSYNLNGNFSEITMNALYPDLETQVIDRKSFSSLYMKILVDRMDSRYKIFHPFLKGNDKKRKITLHIKPVKKSTTSKKVSKPTKGQHRVQKGLKSNSNANQSWHWDMNSYYTHMLRETGKNTLQSEQFHYMKSKIIALIEKIVDDVRKKSSPVIDMQKKYYTLTQYRVGAIVSMVKRCRDEMKQLIAVAVRHKEEAQTADHVKVFELIVQTNVEMTGLVRHLVEYHMEHITKVTASQKLLIM